MLKRREMRIEAIFKMQFQVTQVPPLKAKGLMISLVPVDAEKPTARLEKAKIVEGACTWENPVYETVKLVQEIKTGRIREKFYYLIVSSGSSKSGFLGQVSIDFADLAEATKAMDLVLPLQTSKFGAILHVTVQRMGEDQDSRSTEDSEFLDAETRDHQSYGNRSLHSIEREASREASCHERYGISGDAEAVNSQLKMLGRKAEVADMEAESLKQQIMKETKKGQQLSETIAGLKEERDTVKKESQQLKSDSQKETGSMKILLEGIKKELQCEKHLNDKLKLQLQKTEDSNSEFVLAVRDLNKKMDQKNTKISLLSSKIKALNSEKMDSDEENLLKWTIENLYSEVEVHKKEKEDILMDVKRLTIDVENIEKASKQMYSTLLQTEKEKMEMEQNYRESLATVKQLELRVETLEEETKRHQLQYSGSLTVIQELEIQVKNLQKELENQAQLFEEELNKVTQEKFEQEQRAMRAEEVVRKAKRNNAYRVELLQEELKQLSDEMSLKMEENEKLAHKSIAQTTDLQRMNEDLKSLLWKAEEEHQITTTECERIVHELKEQNKRIYIKEKGDLEKQLASMREEVDKLKQENISIKSQIDLKNSKEVNLNLEVKKLRLKNSDAKNHLLRVELENEDLKKEVAAIQYGFHKNKESVQAKNMNASEPEGRRIGENYSSRPNLRTVDDLRKQIELDTAQIKSLSGEVESLKKRNRSMEQGLEEMRERYSEISLRFAEVEGEREQLVMTLRNLRIGKKD